MAARRVLVAIAVSVVLVISGVSAYWVIRPLIPTHGSKSPITAAGGPNFSLHAYYSPNGFPPWSAASQSWVSVFSAVPSMMPNIDTLSNLTGLTAEMMLYQGLTSTSGNVSGSLNQSNWTTITSEWPSAVSHSTTSVSLWMYTSFQAFNNTTSAWDLYTFDDALPFSPWSPPSSFTATAYYNLAHPAGTLPGLSAPIGGSPSSSQGGNSSGGASSDYSGVQPAYIRCPPNPNPTYKTLWNGYVTGPMPLMMVNNTQRHSGSIDYDGMGDVTNTIKNLTLNFTGSGGTYAYGGYSSSMGSGTTYGANLTFNGSASIAAATSHTDGAFGVIYLDNVTLHVFRNLETLYYYTQPYCRVVSQQVERETTTVVNDTDKHFLLLGGSWNQSYGRLLYDILHSADQGDANLSTTAGHSQHWSTLTGYATGYSSAESVLNDVLAKADLFMTGLDLALAVMDAFDACGIICSIGDVGTTVGVIGDALGLMEYISSAVSSFAYAVSLSENLSTIVITSDGVGSHFQLVGSSLETGLVTAKGSAYPYMPDNVVGWT